MFLSRMSTLVTRIDLKSVRFNCIWDLRCEDVMQSAMVAHASDIRHVTTIGEFCKLIQNIHCIKIWFALDWVSYFANKKLICYFM